MKDSRRGATGREGMLAKLNRFLNEPAALYQRRHIAFRCSAFFSAPLLQANDFAFPLARASSSGAILSMEP
jgi:hypothetical protein